MYTCKLVFQVAFCIDGDIKCEPSNIIWSTFSGLPSAWNRIALSTDASSCMVKGVLQKEKKKMEIKYHH